MKRTSLLLVGVVAAGALGLGGCGKDRELAYKNVQIKELERRNAELEALLAQKGDVAPPVAVGPAPAVDGGWQTKDKDVFITLSNEILFKPGSAVLSDQAKKVLDGVIAEINSKYPNADVRVDGHTDNMPIRRSKDEHKDNWDLSGNRAQAVLQYLSQHGIAEKRLGFAGFGLQRPVSSNATDSGKSKNRRVEILVITNPQASAADG